MNDVSWIIIDKVFRFRPSSGVPSAAGVDFLHFPRFRRRSLPEDVFKNGFNIRIPFPSQRRQQMTAVVANDHTMALFLFP